MGATSLLKAATLHSHKTIEAVAFIHPSSGSETCLACGASTFFVK
jgi:hypothetical protein